MERLFRHKWISIVAAAVSLSLIAAALAVADSPCWALEFACSEEDDAYWEEHYYD